MQKVTCLAILACPAAKGQWLSIFDLSSGIASIPIPDNRITWSGPFGEHLVSLKRAAGNFSTEPTLSLNPDGLCMSDVFVAGSSLNQMSGEKTGQAWGMTATAGAASVLDIIEGVDAWFRGI